VVLVQPSERIGYQPESSSGEPGLYVQPIAVAGFV